MGHRPSRVAEASRAIARRAKRFEDSRRRVATRRRERHRGVRRRRRDDVDDGCDGDGDTKRRAGPTAMTRALGATRASRGRVARVSRVSRDRTTRRARGATRVEAAADKAPSVVVLGGSGFVGARVVEALARAGARVTTISRSGRDATGAREARAVDLAEASAAREALAEALRDVDCVVSCVGVIGGDDEAMRRGNGDHNVLAIEAAKKAGVGRFVYVSVASVVPDVVGKTPLMRGYFEGKRDAEACLRENYAEGDYFIVKPSFIYGGDAFSLTPPRVTKTYGDVLAKVLGSGPVKALAAKAPGPIALTLAEPVSVEDVAGACVAGAMGTYSASNVVDGTDDIKKAAAAVAAA
jgi:nucleoside-diphosphate-sugar epimerase